MCVRERPFPAHWTVREARDAYLHENGFTVDAYDAPFTDAKVLGITFKIPNTKKHRWAIMWHDLHHAVTGYGTDLIGESEISAWEAQRGVQPLGLYVTLIIAGILGVGMVIAPFRTLRAWSAARGDQSLFHEPVDYETCLDMTLGELRGRLGVPREGIATLTRGLHSAAPSA